MKPWLQREVQLRCTMQGPQLSTVLGTSQSIISTSLHGPGSDALAQVMCSKWNRRKRSSPCSSACALSTNKCSQYSAKTPTHQHFCCKRTEVTLRSLESRYHLWLCIVQASDVSKGTHLQPHNIPGPPKASMTPEQDFESHTSLYMSQTPFCQHLQLNWLQPPRVKVNKQVQAAIL